MSDSDHHKVRLAGTVAGTSATAEEIARMGDISKPIAETLLALPPRERFNLMGSLLCTYALSWDMPQSALTTLFTAVLHQLPDIERQVERSERPS